MVYSDSRAHFITKSLRSCDRMSYVICQIGITQREGVAFVKNNLISIIIPHVGGGGAERAFVQLANGLHKAGENVHFVTIANDKGHYRNELIDKMPFFNLNTGRVRYSLVPLCRYINSHKPDIIVTALMNIWMLAMKPFLKNSPKIVISERNNFSEVIKVKKPKYHGCARLLVSKFLYPKANAMVAVSRGVADDLVELGLVKPEKTRVIYNPVISQNFLDLAGEEPSLNLLSNNMPNFIAVGRLHEQKNYPLLLSAFALVRKETKCRLIILGEGELRELVEQKIDELGIKDDVLLPGFIQNPFSYMARADCFVLSSDREGLPGVLIQALGCGTTAVSTDCKSGPSEILDGGKYGTLIPCGDVSALAKAMKNALANPFPKEMLRERAKFFSEENCVNGYLELFEELREV